jgi:hypothetical protein
MQKYAVETQRAKGIKAFRFCSLSLSLSVEMRSARKRSLSLSLFLRIKKRDFAAVVGSREDKKKVEFVISRTRILNEDKRARERK